MGRQLVEYDGGLGSPVIAITLFLSVSALAALCAKHGRRPPQKPDGNTTRSPLASPKKLMTVRNTTKSINHSNNKESNDDGRKVGDEYGSDEEEGGLWKKSIMLGDKCRPPEFSGVIYYDSHGNQLPQMPRSPRASPFHSFSFPVLQNT